MTDQKDELEHRVKAKKKEIEARIEELKADSSAESREKREQLREKLDSLGSTVKEGWDDLTEATAGKLNEWLRS